MNERKKVELANEPGGTKIWFAGIGSADSAAPAAGVSSRPSHDSASAAEPRVLPASLRMAQRRAAEAWAAQPQVGAETVVANVQAELARLKRGAALWRARKRVTELGRHVRGALSDIQRRWSRVPRAQRVALLGLLVACCGTQLMWSSWGPQPHIVQPAPPRIVQQKPAAVSGKAAHDYVRPEPDAAPGLPATTPRAAVDALIAGEPELALRRYQALARANPNQPVYAHAALILSERLQRTAAEMPPE